MKRILAVLLVTLLMLSIVFEFSGCKAKGGENSSLPVDSDSTKQESKTETVKPSAKFINVKADESFIDEEAIYKRISELTSSKYRGRKVGTEGNKLAAEYISAYFREIGLESPENIDNYMQYYEQPIAYLTEEPILQLVDAKKKIIADFKYTEQFFIKSLDDRKKSIDITVPMYLIDTENDLENNKDLKGKILLIRKNLSKRVKLDKLVEKIDEIGALAAIVENDSFSRGRLHISSYQGPWMESKSKYNPTVFVHEEEFSQFVNAADSGCKVHMKLAYKLENAEKVSNIVGMITGSDETLKEQCIIIGAHYDHLGDNMNGTYNSGALDNASGISTMLEIARLLKQNSITPKKSIIFIAFNGEECNLLGSKYFVKNPVCPLSNSMMINLDMVGSAAELPISIMYYGEKPDELSKTILHLANELGIDAVAQLTAGSDNISFAEAGIPAVMLSNKDIVNGYHSPDDTIEDVSKPVLEQFVKLVMYFLDKKAF